MVLVVGDESSRGQEIGDVERKVVDLPQSENSWKFSKKESLGGGNSNIFGIFTPKIGEGSHFDSYFSKGLKPPTRKEMWYAQKFASKEIRPVWDQQKGCHV